MNTLYLVMQHEVYHIIVLNSGDHGDRTACGIDTYTKDGNTTYGTRPSYVSEELPTESRFCKECAKALVKHTPAPL